MRGADRQAARLVFEFEQVRIHAQVGTTTRAAPASGCYMECDNCVSRPPQDIDITRPLRALGVSRYGVVTKVLVLAQEDKAIRDAREAEALQR